MSDFIEIDINTNEVTIRPYTKNEKDYIKSLEDSVVFPEPVVDELAEARVSAINKLKALGLTEDEIKAMVGI